MFQILIVGTCIASLNLSGVDGRSVFFDSSEACFYFPNPSKWEMVRGNKGKTRVDFASLIVRGNNEIVLRWKVGTQSGSFEQEIVRSFRPDPITGLPLVRTTSDEFAGAIRECAFRWMNDRLELHMSKLQNKFLEPAGELWIVFKRIE
jgi:hypothetical protein